MKIFKGNQVIIAVIGFILIVAGYLNFTNNTNINEDFIETGIITDSEQMAGIGDAVLVSTNPKEENTNQIISNNIEDSSKESVNAEIVETDDYFTKSRLERDKMYSQIIESYQKILNNSSIGEEQKKITQQEILKINEQKNAIMITENLIKTKGIEDLIIFINDNNINIIVKSKELKPEQIAQIQNIVTRELKAKISNIHITNKD